MLLLTKGRPTKARCAGCRRLFALTDKVLESLLSRRSTMVICDVCKRAMEEHEAEPRRKYN